MTHHFKLPSSFLYRTLIGAVVLWTGPLSASSAQEQPGQEIVVQEPPAATKAVADFSSCTQPAYPKAALREEQHGTVTVALLIGVDGTVRDTKVVTSSGFPLLDMATLDGIGKCRFFPGTMDGKPTESWTEIQYVWVLDEANKNPPAMIAAARQGAKRGVAAEQYHLGNAYLNGNGVPRKVSEGMKWLRVAAKQGHAKAQEVVGLMLQGETEGIPPNLVASAAWLRKAAKQGLPRAQYVLGGLLVQGRGIKANPDEGIRWMRKAAEQGDADGQTMLAVTLLQKKPDPARTADAIALLDKAAAQNNEFAQAILGQCFETGTGVTQDYAAAAAMYEKASKSGNRNALNRLAGMYERGEGVPVDFAKATLLRAAAERKPSSPPQ